MLHLVVAAAAGSNSAVAAHAAGTMWAQYWVVAGIHRVIAARASLCCCGTRLACRCCFDARMRLHEIAPLSLLRCAQFNDCENRVQQHSRWWQRPRGAAGPGSSRRKWPETPRTFRHRGRWCTLQACPVQTTLSWLFCKGQQPQGSFRLLPRCPPLTAVTLRTAVMRSAADHLPAGRSVPSHCPSLTGTPRGLQPGLEQQLRRWFRAGVAMQAHLASC